MPKILPSKIYKNKKIMICLKRSMFVRLRLYILIIITHNFFPHKTILHLNLPFRKSRDI